MALSVRPARALTAAGDCNDNGLVVINELVVAVAIALGSRPLADCVAADTNEDDMVDVADLIRAVNEALQGGIDAAFQFTHPVGNPLSLARNVAVAVDLPADADVSTLALYVDGVLAPGIFGGTAGASSTLPQVAPGEHALQARVRVNHTNAHVTAIANTSFEAVDLLNPDNCEVLNNVECLLPYPSSRFLEPADTPTGYRLAFPEGTIPAQNGQPLQSASYRVLDGFSPTVQILMHFPGGVDVVGSNASRLLPDRRTYDGRSLEPDSPTILLDANTGERILHFVELDDRATSPARQVLFLRPARSLAPGHHYIVAARFLLHPDGTPVVAEPAFVALRDERTTDIDAIIRRQGDFDETFSALAQAGIDRNSLILAFDFRVGSDQTLTSQMLSMRDQSFAYLAAAEQPTFTVNHVEEADCDAPGVTTWRIVDGTFKVPLFLTRDPLVDRPYPAMMNVDAEGMPVQNGLTNPPFSIALPCSARTGAKLPPVVLGHGLLGNGAGFVRQLANFDIQNIGAATDWLGLADADLNDPDALNSFLAKGVTLNLNNIAALADRMRQGQLNTLVLGRMMKFGLFNTDPAFQANGVGVFPGPEQEEFYFGASLGGIMGLMFSALSPDVQNSHVDVPGINFSLLLQRATPFIVFEQALQLSGVTDPMSSALLLGVTHELWVRGEPAAYATHITSDPLPGTNAKHILMTVAYLDQEVSNVASEIAGRTLGLRSLEGSVMPGLVDMPDLPGPLDSAYVVYDTASFDLGNPAHAPFIPPLTNRQPEPNHCDPHGRQAFIPAAIQQLTEFLRPGGVIRNFCDGLCDAGDPHEIPNGDTMRCDPLGGVTPIDRNRIDP